jgi:hypothetical protein
MLAFEVFAVTSANLLGVVIKYCSSMKEIKPVSVLQINKGMWMHY